MRAVEAGDRVSVAQGETLDVVGAGVAVFSVCLGDGRCGCEGQG